MQKVYSVSKIKAAETQAIKNGISEIELVERVAKSIFEAVKFSENVAIVCGKGNNASDGFALSILLKNAQKKVKVFCASLKLNQTAQFFFDKLDENSIPHSQISENENFEEFDDIVDCIFGTGFSGKVDEYYKSVIESINLSKKRIISVDVPSGLNAENGLCEFAVKCDINVAIGGLKQGLVLNMAKDYIKQNIVVDIGLNAKSSSILADGDDFKDVFFERNNYSHKGNYGTVAVLGGSLQYSGAAKLSAMSMLALSVGAGVSRLIVPKCIADSVLRDIITSTLFVLPEENGFLKFDENELSRALYKLDALSFGMGIGNNKETIKTLEYILNNYSFKLCIDADGLNALAQIDKEILKRSKCKIVITPHIKEFSRLTNYSVEEILQNPIALAENFAREYKIIVLLKGTSTIITDGEQTVIVNTGCPGMATAGSGDVLSGIVVGILGYNDLTVEAISCGAFINGLAGEMAQKESCSISMTSLDTVKSVPKAVTKIFMKNQK